jgi:hypothetical protein
MSALGERTHLVANEIRMFARRVHRLNVLNDFSYEPSHRLMIAQRCDDFFFKKVHGACYRSCTWWSIFMTVKRCEFDAAVRTVQDSVMSRAVRTFSFLSSG